MFMLLMEWCHFLLSWTKCQLSEMFHSEETFWGLSGLSEMHWMSHNSCCFLQISRRLFPSFKRPLRMHHLWPLTSNSQVLISLWSLFLSIWPHLEISTLFCLMLAGLYLPEYNSHALDTPPEYYQKLRLVSSSVLLTSFSPYLISILHGISWHLNSFSSS